jgi:hypothetical protein
LGGSPPRHAATTTGRGCTGWRAATGSAAEATATGGTASVATAGRSTATGGTSGTAGRAAAGALGVGATGA